MFAAETADGTRRTLALEEHPADPIVESIVLATDGGEAGAGAMRWVTHRGKMHRLNVLVLAVAETAGFGARLSGSMLAAERDAVERTAQEIARNAPSAQVDWRVDVGDARQRLAAASAPEDMIVVGSNRAGPMAAVLGATLFTEARGSRRVSRDRGAEVLEARARTGAGGTPGRRTR